MLSTTLDPDNGLVADKTREDWPASIAATGLALAAYPMGVEHGFLTRAEAVEKTLATLRFFWNSPQGPERDATGYKGFYYHFLEMKTGRRHWSCELLNHVHGNMLNLPQSPMISGLDKQNGVFAQSYLLGRFVQYAQRTEKTPFFGEKTSLTRLVESIFFTLSVRILQFATSFKSLFNDSYTNLSC